MVMLPPLTHTHTHTLSLSYFASTWHRYTLNSLVPKETQPSTLTTNSAFIDANKQGRCECLLQGPGCRRAGERARSGGEVLDLDGCWSAFVPISQFPCVVGHHSSKRVLGLRVFSISLFLSLILFEMASCLFSNSLFLFASGYMRRPGGD